MSQHTVAGQQMVDGQQIVTGQQKVRGTETVVGQHVAFGWEGWYTAMFRQETVFQQQTLLVLTTNGVRQARASWEMCQGGLNPRQSPKSECHGVKQGAADMAGDGTDARHVPKRIRTLTWC